MATLTEEVKLFIVQGLACYDTPSQVAEAVKEQFGLVIDRRQVENYDPDKAAGRNLARKFVAIFRETRATFLKDVSTIPIAQQSYRLRVLQRTLTKVEKQGNTAMVTTVLEQAAKETGGAFTNRRELTGKDGAPIATAQMPVPADPMEAAAVYQKVMQGG